MIKNIPTYAKNYDAIITTRIGTDHWFYGAYDLETANELAYDMRLHGKDAVVFEVKDIPELSVEPIRGTAEQWHIFYRWNTLTNQSKFHVSQIEREMIENEKQFLEALAY